MLCITTDRTGFPLVRVPALSLDVHLWPITKLQFEAYLAETQALDDEQYAELLQLNPRGCAKSCWEDMPETALLTGILPEEAEAFTHWLGTEYRLLSTGHWQTIWRHFTRLDARRLNLEEIISCADHATANWLKALIDASPARSRSMAEHTRMQGGVMEWVAGKRGWQVLGQPREAFAEQLFSCSHAVTPIDVSKRNRLFGFRLVRVRNR